MKYCNPTTFGIKSISCLYPVIPDRKVFKDNLPLKIIDIVCFHFSITEFELCGASRFKPIPDARAIAMNLIFKSGDISKSAIGRLLGRDHSTVITAIERCEDFIKNDKKFAADYAAIKERLNNYILNIPTYERSAII